MAHSSVARSLLCLAAAFTLAACSGSTSDAPASPADGSSAVDSGSADTRMDATAADTAVADAAADTAVSDTGGDTARADASDSAPPRSCTIDTDCTQCAYPTAPTKASDCYCIDCTTTPMSATSCAANEAAWTKHCSPWPTPASPCPIPKCLAPLATSCDKGGQCVVAPGACRTATDCGYCQHGSAPTTAAECACPTCPVAMSTASCTAITGAVTKFCAGFDFSKCPLPPCAKPPALTCSTDAPRLCTAAL